VADGAQAAQHATETHNSTWPPQVTSKLKKTLLQAGALKGSDKKRYCCVLPCHLWGFSLHCNLPFFFSLSFGDVEKSLAETKKFNIKTLTGKRLLKLGVKIGAYCPVFFFGACLSSSSFGFVVSCSHFEKDPPSSSGYHRQGRFVVLLIVSLLVYLVCIKKHTKHTIA
jgi:hypothetical protein